MTLLGQGTGWDKVNRQKMMVALNMPQSFLPTIQEIKQGTDKIMVFPQRKGLLQISSHITGPCTRTLTPFQLSKKTDKVDFMH